MRRFNSLAFLLLLAAGCQIAPERLAIKPLPEEGDPLPYAELATRARLQATSATEFFYVDKWTELEEAAKALEQTTRFLPKATEVPAKHKDTLAGKAAELSKDAVRLREAAQAKDPKKANEALTRIQLMVRELRPE